MAMAAISAELPPMPSLADLHIRIAPSRTKPSKEAAAGLKRQGLLGRGPQKATKTLVFQEFLQEFGFRWDHLDPR
jgi:hypothetical protein